MLYISRNSEGFVTDISEIFHAEAVTAHDLTSMEAAEELATACTKFSNAKYLGIDRGNGVSPRYSIAKAPCVGEAISAAINGDLRPEGHIKSISASGRVVTASTGKKFYRKGLTGSWKNGSFSMVAGHRNETNPSF